MKEKNDSFHETVEDNEVEIVTLEDDEGNAVDFVVIATLKLDDTEYALLAEKKNPAEIMVFRVEDYGDDFVLEGVDNEEELDQVMLAYAELQ